MLCSRNSQLSEACKIELCCLRAPSLWYFLPLQCKLITTCLFPLGLNLLPGLSASSPALDQSILHTAARVIVQDANPIMWFPCGPCIAPGLKSKNLIGLQSHLGYKLGFSLQSQLQLPITFSFQKLVFLFSLDASYDSPHLTNHLSSLCPGWPGLRKFIWLLP